MAARLGRAGNFVPAIDLIRNFSREHKEKLIYDPRKPSNAVVIDTLPGPVARYILKKLYPSYI